MNWIKFTLVLCVFFTISTATYSQEPVKEVAEKATPDATADSSSTPASSSRISNQLELGLLFSGHLNIYVAEKKTLLREC